MLNPFCKFGMDVESSYRFLLQCLFIFNKRCTLMSHLNKIHPQRSKYTFLNLTNTFLFGNPSFIDKINTLILDATIEYILLTEAVVQRCSVKKVFLEVSQNSQENICARVSFFNKVTGLRLLEILSNFKLYLKRNSGTGVLL